MFITKNRVAIDRTLFEKAAIIAKRKGYATMDEFVSHLLENEIRSQGEELTKEKVLEKLKGLGYLQ